MNKLLILCTFLFTIAAQSQIRGRVVDQNQQPLPFVNITIENTYNGTTSNDNGEYVLDVKDAGSYTIIFQYLGFKTVRIKQTIERFPHTIDIAMTEENISLNEVLISSKENPANAIIKSAIAARGENSSQMSNYKADFYSRGMFRIKNAPRRFLGQKIELLEQIVDSSRSGILYLSETVSKIQYSKPDKFKETIIASRVSGSDNGFSFNNAASANFDFYQNYLPFAVSVISPIASNAFNYYNYKLEGTFFDDDLHQINKIRVTPKRESEPAFNGYIYIVENSWALYAVDLRIKGSQIETNAIESLSLKQNFSYNKNTQFWAKNSQVLDFEAGILSIEFSGRFTYVYSNYNFEPNLTKKDFGPEVLSFDSDANKKPENYWNAKRPIPLTIEESTDYKKKDALQIRRKTKQFLDSIDRRSNKFKVLDIVTGYTFSNSFENEYWRYDGILTTTSFNTVQGYNAGSGLSYTKRNPEKQSFTTIGTDFNYGIAEDRFRISGYITRKFNNVSDLQLTLAGGSSILQFNPENPISRIVNGIATAFFKNNYMKLYDRTFAKINYAEEVANGLVINGQIEYSRRKQLFNNTEESIIRNDRGYTSNNPLAPNDFTTPFFDTHSLFQASVETRISFGQQYWSRPDGKINIPNNNFPVIYLKYIQGFGGSEKDYDYSQAEARLTYDIDLKNKGTVGMNIKAGKFFNADDITFVDYKHFNGNQTHIGQSDRYLNVFNLLPYYVASTNQEYTEAHFEYSDDGYFTNKIPLVNLLRANLVIGFHNLTLPNQKPYSEASVGLDNLGFGKVRFFRIDYVRSYQSGFQTDGVVFGLKFLNILN